MVADTEVCVIGGGVVGLAIGWAVAKSGRDVTVLERHKRPGLETSLRSSEVIHAGLYYPPGSLKAQLCRTGAAFLSRFCETAGVSVNPCGKLIVATSDDEIDALQLLQHNARRNGVTDLQLLSATESRALEPALACSAALLSPSTAVFDSSAFLIALEGALASASGDLVLQTEVTGLAKSANGDFAVDIQSSSGPAKFTCRQLVLSGGAAATQLGRMMAYPKAGCVPETYFAKGHYYALAGSAPFRHLIYPVPSAGGLGIHFTRDISGAAKFGPDVVWCAQPDHTFDDGDGTRRKTFAAAISKYWPALGEDSLSPAYVGVRPKLSAPGQPARDFALLTSADHGVDNLIGCYGIESPGLTASLAIGDWVAHRLT